MHMGSIPSPISILFTTNNLHHNYNTRQKYDLHKQILKKENCYTLFSFHGISIWNPISKNIPIDVSYACYKLLPKKYLQSNIFIFV